MPILWFNRLQQSTKAGSRKSGDRASPACVLQETQLRAISCRRTLQVATNTPAPTLFELDHHHKDFSLYTPKHQHSLSYPTSCDRAFIAQRARLLLLLLSHRALPGEPVSDPSAFCMPDARDLLSGVSNDLQHLWYNFSVTPSSSSSFYHDGLHQYIHEMPIHE